MALKQMKRYSPQDCRKNPDWLFVFGDNLMRYGSSGQAIIRGMPNAIGIATKKKPAMDNEAFFNDGDYVIADNEFHDKFKIISWYLSLGGTVVFPADGIGTGLADLENRAPKIWKLLQQYKKNLNKKPTFWD